MAVVPSSNVDAGVDSGVRNPRRPFYDLVPSPDPVAASVRQRVYDAVAGWCYYSGAVRSSPDAGDTVPVHTGALSAHQILP